METFSFHGKTYEVDSQNFLNDFKQWDEDFAVGLAPDVNIPGGLTEKHWDVIRFIRDSFKQKGGSPLVYETCRVNGLSHRNLKTLFPTGYLRGACKLAGITYRDRTMPYYGEQARESRVRPVYEEAPPKPEEKVYRVDSFGFLVDPSEWDEDFAINKAYEMKMEGGLSDKHWKLILSLRDSFEKDKFIPTLFECCDANQIELEELERLFPHGYHRGLVKMAGLRAVAN